MDQDQQHGGIQRTPFRVGELYLISKINAQCEWYEQKNNFEGKVMRCVEVFEEEDAAGFRFVKWKDCPAGHKVTEAFCFSGVEAKCLNFK